MNLTFWVALLFGVSLALYFLGGQSQLQSALDKYENDEQIGTEGEIASNNTDAIWNSLIQSILSWNTALIILAVGAGALMGLNLLALIPLAAIMLVLNYAVFPLEFINGTGLPVEVSMPLTLFFTLTEIMIFFSLVRGSFR